MLLHRLHGVLVAIFPQTFGTEAQRLGDDEQQVLVVLAGRGDRPRTQGRLGLPRWRAALSRLQRRADIFAMVTGEQPLRPDELPAEIAPDASLYLTRAGWERMGEPLSDTDLAALRWVVDLGAGVRSFSGPISDRMKLLGLVEEEGGVTLAGIAVLRAEGATTHGPVDPPVGWTCPVQPIDGRTGATLPVCGRPALKGWRSPSGRVTVTCTHEHRHRSEAPR